jgi:DNA anti-recombination protein RmuC
VLSLYTTVAICFTIAILGLSFHKRWSPRQIVQGPALLTMLGIAGTFLGIAVGLLSFNPDDIQHSVPGLIDGMRTAVWASLFGIVWAVSIKFRYAFAREASTQDANRSDAEMIASQLEALQKAIAGDDESTVIGQMKMGRTDMNDRLDAIKRSQDAFMEKLAEMSSKTLIEALRQVIQDFNLNLNEQFGENFKQLNVAVHKLVEWQQQYREQMDRLIAIERETCEQLQDATNQQKAALSASEGLFVVAQGFRSILEVADSYKSNLKQNTDALANLVQEVRHDVPALRSEITDLITTVSGAVTKHETEIGELSRQIAERFNVAADTVKSELTNALATANKQVSDNISKLVGSTKEQTEALHAALEEALNESLRTLSQQLASLSGKFAEDYGPITDRLREIVRIGRNAA